MPAGNSDAAEQLWQWVLADPEAKAWLDGTPDELGMVVNPYYNAKPTVNPSKGEFDNPVPNSFPKADPYCYQAPSQGSGGTVVPPQLCGTDWMPYARGFRESAQVTRAASDGARIAINTLAESSSAVWGRAQPQGTGDRAMLAVTDSPSAAQFGLQVASLSRAGDDGATREFVTPGDASFTKAVGSMKKFPGADFLQPTPSPAAGAYPLTTMNYAAITPLKLPAAARKDYAAFLDYAATKGQVPGLGFGQLPRGYTPLPAAMAATTKKAAASVRTLQPTPTTTTTVSSEPVTTFPSDDGGGGGFVPGDGSDGGDTFTTDPVTETTTAVTDAVTTVATTVAPSGTDPSTTYELLATPARRPAPQPLHGSGAGHDRPGVGARCPRDLEATASRSGRGARRYPARRSRVMTHRVPRARTTAQRVRRRGGHHRVGARHLGAALVRRQRPRASRHERHRAAPCR